MSVARKHAVRLAALALLVVTASGCGVESPLGPSLAAPSSPETALAPPTAESSAQLVAIEPEPLPTDGVVVTTLPFDDRATSPDRQKKPKKDNPGRHRGWD